MFHRLAWLALAMMIAVWCLVVSSWGTICDGMWPYSKEPVPQGACRGFFFMLLSILKLT